MRYRSWLVAAIVGLGIGVGADRKCWAEGALHLTIGQSQPNAPYRSLGVVHLDDDGNPVLPDPQNTDTPDSDAEAGSNAERDAAAHTAPELQPAPGGGEMILLDESLRHRSSARVRRATGESTAVILCESPAVTSGERPRAAAVRDACPHGRHEPGTQ